MMWCERKISPGNHYRLNIFPTRVPEVVNYCEYIYIFHTTSSEKNPLNIFKDYYDITRVLEVSMNIHIFHVTHNDLCLAAAGHETSLENLSSPVFRIYLFSSISQYNYCIWRNYGKSEVWPGCYIWSAQHSEPFRWR